MRKSDPAAVTSAAPNAVSNHVALFFLLLMMFACNRFDGAAPVVEEPDRGLSAARLGAVWASSGWQLKIREELVGSAAPVNGPGSDCLKDAAGLIRCGGEPAFALEGADYYDLRADPVRALRRGALKVPSDAPLTVVPRIEEISESSGDFGLHWGGCFLNVSGRELEPLALRATLVFRGGESTFSWPGKLRKPTDRSGIPAKVDPDGVFCTEMHGFRADEPPEKIDAAYAVVEMAALIDGLPWIGPLRIVSFSNRFPVDARASGRAAALGGELRPSPNSRKGAVKVHPPELLKITERSAGKVLAESADGRKGWINAADLSPMWPEVEPVLPDNLKSALEKAVQAVCLEGAARFCPSKDGSPKVIIRVLEKTETPGRIAVTFFAGYASGLDGSGPAGRTLDTFLFIGEGGEWKRVE